MSTARLAYVALSAILWTWLAGAGRADEATYGDRMRQAEAVLRQAEQHFARGERPAAALLASRARGLLREADAAKPSDLRVGLLRVYAAIFAHDREGADNALETYLGRSPRGERDPAVHYARALVHMHLDRRPDQAVQALEKMREIAPAEVHDAARTLHLAALNAWSAHSLERSDCERTMALLHQAVEVARETRDEARVRRARSRIAVALSRCSRYRESEVAFRELVAEQPDHALWTYDLALTIASQARFEEALPHYRRALELLKKGRTSEANEAVVRQAWLKLGNCHRILAGRESDPEVRKAGLDASRRAFSRYLQLVPQDARGHYWLGVLLYDELGLPHRALEGLERAHALDPACDGALRKMIQIASRHAPRLTGKAAEDVERRRLWAQRLEAWKKDLEKNEAERRRVRKARKARSPDGSDRCL